MKIIKFRSAHYNFDGTFNCFTYWGRIDHHNKPTNKEIFKSPEDVSGTIIKTDEQLLELRDKNKKEIYEGDKVEMEMSYENEADGIYIDGKYIGFIRIIASKGACLYNPEFINNDGDNYTINQYKPISAYRCKVIGNIHEKKIMENPKGWLGKNWKDMTKQEVLNAFFHLWKEKEELAERLFEYEQIITNIPKKDTRPLDLYHQNDES